MRTFPALALRMQVRITAYKEKYIYVGVESLYHSSREGVSYHKTVQRADWKNSIVYVKLSILRTKPLKKRRKHKNKIDEGSESDVDVW